MRLRGAARARRVGLTGLLCWCAGCSGAESPGWPLAATPDATRPQAVRILERPTLGVGEVSGILIAVRTAPGHSVRPPPPPSIPGLHVLQVEDVATRTGDHDWLHRTRIRIRADRPGSYTLPASRIVVESPDGRQQSLELPAARLEVTSVLPRYRPDQQPFGLRRPDTRDGAAGFLPGLLTGALGALLLVGLPLGLRRSLAGRRSAEKAAEEPVPDLDEWAMAELARARRALQEDPRHASNMGAALLRVYAAQRFCAPVVAATTHELERARPPSVELPVWSDFVRILRRYDALRFQPRPRATPPGQASGGELVGRCLDETERFLRVLRESIPPGERPC